MFVGYVSIKGVAFIDRALDLPRVWTEDEARRAAAGVPPQVRFATKVALAQRLLARAFAAAVPARWVVADRLDGRGQAVRRWREQQGRSPVVGLLAGQVVEHDGRRQRASALAARFPAAAWVRRSAGEGSQGPRVHDGAWVRLCAVAPAGMARWLLVRRALENPAEQDFFGAYGPADTPVDDLVRVAGLRWAIEEGFAQAKGAVGLDQYAGRGWPAWQRQMTLCLLAHAALAVRCAAARQAEGSRRIKGGLAGPRADRADGP